MSSRPSAKDVSRLVALQEGTLPEDDFDQLQEDLCKNPELRREWIRLQHLDGALGHHFQGHSGEPISRKGTLFPVLGLVASVAFGISALILLNRNRSPDIEYVAVDLPGLDPVAIVTRVDGADQVPGFRVGDTVRPGTVTLEEGTLELTFFSGASLSLEGPAQLQLMTQDQTYLTRGKAAARVPEEAVGFTVKTPEAAVVDLGTEFAIAVDEVGDSTVHVYDGEVRVSLLGNDGSTLTSSPVLTGGSLGIEIEEQRLLPIEGDPAPLGALPRASRPPQRPLEVPPRYTRMVSEAMPEVYWSFDGDADGSLTDRSGNGWHAKPTGETSLEGGGIAFAGGSGESAYLASPLVPGINDGPYTVELWVNPARLHYATLVALCVDAESKGNEGRPARHLSVIELMTYSHLIHRPGSIRFLHRWNGGEVNAFSETCFVPGRWHHIVAVRAEDEVRLYVNGELARTVRKERESGGEPFRVVLGQLDHVRSTRQFEGLMDEFALYRRALDEGEIRSHYQAMELPKQ